MERNPESGQMQMLFNAGDVEAEKEKRRAAAQAGVPITPRPPSPASAGTNALAMVAPAMLALADRIQNPAAPAAAPVALRSAQPWLTLTQAAEYSGLPEGFLRELIVAGRLPMLDVGHREGGRLRVKTTDLDALQGRAREERARTAGA
jgi:excisionase family DNA binding protein